MTFYLTLSRTWCTCFVTLEYVISIFLKDLKTTLCKHNQKEVEAVRYIKVYAKGVVKNGFVYKEISDTNLLYQFRDWLNQQMLGSSESFIRSEDVHWRDFLKYNQDILLLHTVPLYTMFKALACQSLYSVLNKIDFVLSWPKCSLNLLSTNQSHKHEKSLSSCFSISVTFYVGKLCKYHLHKIIDIRTVWIFCL